MIYVSHNLPYFSVPLNFLSNVLIPCNLSLSWRAPPGVLPGAGILLSHSPCAPLPQVPPPSCSAPRKLYLQEAGGRRQGERTRVVPSRLSLCLAELHPSRHQQALVPQASSLRAPPLAFHPSCAALGPSCPYLSCHLLIWSSSETSDGNCFLPGLRYTPNPENAHTEH